MDKKTFWIGILSLTATLLFVANYFAPSATASLTVRDRDFSMVTARVNKGGEALYVLDNRSGLVAVMSFDPARGAIQLRKVRSMSDAFAGTPTR